MLKERERTRKRIKSFQPAILSRKKNVERVKLYLNKKQQRKTQTRYFNWFCYAPVATQYSENFQSRIFSREEKNRFGSLWKFSNKITYKFTTQLNGKKPENWFKLSIQSLQRLWTFFFFLLVCQERMKINKSYIHNKKKQASNLWFLMILQIEKLNINNSIHHSNPVSIRFASSFTHRRRPNMTTISCKGWKWLFSRSLSLDALATTKKRIRWLRIHDSLLDLCLYAKNLRSMVMTFYLFHLHKGVRKCESWQKA